MSKVALVLSGGGARGAFQAAAEKYCREVLGYRWDVIAGVSVGALNGCMLSMRKEARLWDIWNTISNRDVYTGKIGLRALLRVLRRKKSLLGNAPLFRMITDEVDPALFRIPFQIGVVSLMSGDFVMVGPDHPEFEKAILASTAVPLIWSPVESTGHLKEALDGGVRVVCPIHAVMDHEPDEIVAITCFDRQIPPLLKAPRDFMEIAERFMYIVTHQNIATDVDGFRRVNRMAWQAAEKGVTLYRPDGRPYRPIKFTLIEPDESGEPLHHILDFSRESLDRAMVRGREAAAKAFAK